MKKGSYSSVRKNCGVFAYFLTIPLIPAQIQHLDGRSTKK